MNISHLIAFYGRHLLGSISPVLDQRLGVQQLTLLCDQRLAESCKNTASTLSSKGWPTRVLLLEDMELPGIVKKALDSVIYWHKNQTQLVQGQILLNLAGANPIAASIATQVFRQQGLPICSIGSRANRLIWLSVPTQFPTTAAMDLDNPLRLREILELHGMKVPDCWQWLGQRQVHWDNLCQDMVAQAARNPAAVAQFGARCRVANSEDKIVPSLFDDSHLVRQLGQMLLKHGLASKTACGGLRLDSAELIDFVSGGWLEHYVLMQFERLQAKGLVADAACGLILDQDGVTNELDGICLSGNRLFIVECKARKGVQRGSTSPVGIGPETIYKIDSIRAIRNFEAGAIIVSLAEISELEKSRLAVEGIEALCWRDLSGLEQKLEKMLTR